MNINRNRNQIRIRRTVVAVLIVAALIAVVGVILVSRCLSFDENGAHVIDRYGVLAEEQGQTRPELTAGSAETPAEPEPAEPEPEKEPETAPQPQVKYTRALMLAASSAAEEGTRARLLKLAEQGVQDTVIVNIKDSEGNLNLPVETDVVDGVSDFTEGDADGLKSTIAALRDAGVHVVGRIYCFHDRRAASRNSDLAIQFERGGSWLDYDNTRWLDPTNGDALAYLDDVARAAVQAGCDEIVLADFTFPPRGHLDRADFADWPDTQAEALAAALKDIQGAVGDVPVSLTADSLGALTALSPSGSEDGISVGEIGALLGAAHRLFVPVETAEEAASAIQQLREAASNPAVVPVFSGSSLWSTYNGDAALNGVSDSEAALAALEGGQNKGTADAEPTQNPTEENTDAAE